MGALAIYPGTCAVHRAKSPGRGPRAQPIAYVTAYKAAGYDLLKVHSESEDMFDSVLAAARNVGIPVAGDLGGHRPVLNNSFLEKALTGKIRSIEHFSRHPNQETISPAEMQSFVDATVRAGT